MNDLPTVNKTLKPVRLGKTWPDARAKAGRSMTAKPSLARFEVALFGFSAPTGRCYASLAAC